MKIIMERKLNETYTKSIIEDLILNNELGELCESIVDDLRKIAFDVAKTSKLEGLCKKDLKSASVWLNTLTYAKDILNEAKHRG